MKKLIVLTEVAHLPTNVKGESLSSHAFQDEYSKEVDRANERGLDTADSFDYSEAPESILSRENTRLASSVQIEISELLEQWDEQELQGQQEEEVSLVSFDVFSLRAGNSLFKCRKSLWRRFCSSDEPWNSSATSFLFRRLLEVSGHEKSASSLLK
jgi:uncharacterized protein (DUF885 family)